MKTLTCIQPGTLVYGEAPLPVIAENRAIIKIKRIGVCGTDLHAYQGNQPYFNYPRILGHELSGELVDNAYALDFENGEAVTFLPYFNCGICIACRRQLPNCCVQLKVFGVHIDGGMAEYISIPADKLVHGNGLTFDELAMVEPLAISAHAVQRAQITPGEFVVVMGAGPIGLGVMEFARMAGAKVIAVDVSDARLEFCTRALGLQHVINGSKEDVAERINAITNGDYATVVFDATGNLNAINKGINYLAHGGRYVLVGLQKNDFSFNHPEFHKRETSLLSSRNATGHDFEAVINAIKNKDISPLKYITNRVLFDEVKESFNHWVNPANGVIKPMISME